MYNILICDDEPDIVSALKIYLTGDEYQLFEAYNGRQALETVDGTLQTARKDIDAALGATERRVSIALENQQTEVSGKLRLMRLHRMLGLEL